MPLGLACILWALSFNTQSVSPQKKNIVDFIEIKMSILKELIQKIKIQATNWEKNILKIHICYKIWTQNRQRPLEQPYKQ